MMDFHILIVISCVFLASLFSWLILNKFFRRKTFDEIIAEKKALTEKINAQNKAITKKPKKLINLKKEQKREKKQRQREERQRDAAEHDDSEDNQSEIPNLEDETPGLSKTHVEFEPDPEIVTLDSEVSLKRQSNAEKESASVGVKQKSKKEKKSVAKSSTSSGGILVNKNEPIAVKVNANFEEPLNNFETKPPKDFVELKKADKERKEEKVATLAQPQSQTQTQTQQQHQNQSKKEKHANKKEKASNNATDAPQIATNKDVKQAEEKIRQASPKIQQNGPSTLGKSGRQQQKKHGHTENSSAKEIMHALDKLSDADTVSVNLLMNLFRRAELNRSEIQILIDYLLNKQQDTPATHSEWSDDICQKLKRQLEEKERLLTEEQEASAGIQAKLRELRTEINTERLQMNATIKAYTEKLQSKDQEINGLNQELQAVNEKLNNERQQFQAKLVREKQASSQDLLTQLQLMQNELAHKDKCINDLTCLVNASRQAVEESQQKNEIIQSQAQQMRALEQQRDELEQVSNNRIFELEKLKELETENAEIKVELLNLQNALESSKVDLTQARKDLDAVNSELALARNVELSEKQQQIQALQAKNTELSQQLVTLTNRKEEREQHNSKEQTGMQATLDALRIELAEKEKQLTEFVTKNTELLQQHSKTVQKYGQQEQELQNRIESLSADASTKHKQLQEVERIHAEKYANRETELLLQLQEQKEKNNDLRLKNWKLVEALQNAETTTLKENKMLSKHNASLVQSNQQQFQAANANSTSQDEKQLRELFQRICPEAVKVCAGSALSLPIDQWIEQVLTTHIKQSIATRSSSSSNKSTQSNSNSSNDSSSHTNKNSNSNHNSSSHNSHKNNNNNNNTLISESSLASASAATQTTNVSNNSRSTPKGGENSSIDIAEHQKIIAENAQLRVQNSELTRLVTKTSNTLSELEGQAREQDENWRSIVRLKDEKINALQHSNGEQDI